MHELARILLRLVAVQSHVNPKLAPELLKFAGVTAPLQVVPGRALKFPSFFASTFCIFEKHVTVNMAP
jgi:hypothetical protein